MKAFFILFLSSFQLSTIQAQEASVVSEEVHEVGPSGKYALDFSLNKNASDDENIVTLSRGLGPIALGTTTSFFKPSNHVNEQEWNGITCLQQSGLAFDFSITNLDRNVSNVMGIQACQSTNTSKLLRFTEENCSLKQSCSQFILSKDNVENNADNTHDNLVVGFVADDYATYHIETFSAQMDEIDKIRDFVDESSDKKLMPTTCKPKFVPETLHSFSTDQCEPVYIDAAYAKIQEDCKLGKRGCSFSSRDGMKSVANDWDTFNAFLGAAGVNTGKMSRYEGYVDFKKNQYFKDLNNNDKVQIDKLVTIISSKDNPGEKLKQIFKFLEEEKKNGLLDPVLTYTQDFLSSEEAVFKKSPHLKFFKELIQSHSKLNKDGIKDAFVKYRMEAASQILKSDCESTPSFLDICRETTAISKNRGGAYWDAAIYSRREPNGGEEFDRFLQLQKLRPNGIKDAKDYNVIMDAQRCTTFGEANDFKKKKSDLAFNYSNIANGYSLSLLPSNQPLSYGPSQTELKEAVNDYFVSEHARQKAAKLQEATDRKNADILKYWKNEETEKSEKVTNGPSNTKVNDPSKVDKSETMALKEDAANNSKAPKESDTKTVTSEVNALVEQHNKIDHVKSENWNGSSSGTDRNYNSAASTFNSFNKTIRSSDDQDSSSSVKSKSSESTNALSGKIEELTRKLTTSEANFEKYKAEKVAEEEEKLKQAKLEADAKIIADLQTQINTLKTDAKKQISNSSHNVEKSQTEGSAVSFSGSGKYSRSETEKSLKETTSTDIPRDQSVRNYSVAASGTATSTADSNFRSSTSPRVGASAIGNAYSNDSRSNIVLTTMDGLSNEKATEKINEKISELKGSPFFIEEGGVVIQIIPKIVNDVVLTDKFGMPIYETILVEEDAKVAKDLKTQQTKSKREPANITSKADLKRDQEEKIKHDRAEYLKLKKITNGVLK